MSNVYLSLDIESDGPIPGLYSMRELGAVAFDYTGRVLDKFSVCLLPLKEAHENPETIVFWQKFPVVWKRIQDSSIKPIEAIAQFDQWLRKVQMQGKITCICWPASFDFPYVAYYLWRFTGECILGHSCLDIKTMLCDLIGEYHKFLGKRKLPDSCRVEVKHTHCALDDALEQGMIFFKLREAMKDLREGKA